MQFFILFTIFLVILKTFEAAEDVKVSFSLKVKGRNQTKFTLESKENVLNSSFDPSLPTTFFIHGYWENPSLDHHVKTRQ